MLYMVTFAINIPPMLAYIPYMDPMGMLKHTKTIRNVYHSDFHIPSAFCAIVRILFPRPMEDFMAQYTES